MYQHHDTDIIKASSISINILLMKSIIIGIMKYFTSIIPNIEFREVIRLSNKGTVVYILGEIFLILGYGILLIFTLMGTAETANCSLLVELYHFVGLSLIRVRI